MSVDPDAVLHLGSALGENFGFGDNANTHDHQIAREGVVVGAHGEDPVLFAEDFHDVDTRQDGDAATTVCVGVEVRDWCAGHPRQKAVGGFESVTALPSLLRLAAASSPM